MSTPALTLVPRVTQVIHLLSQRGQPYGSVSRKCYHCGMMIWNRPLPEGHVYTEEEALYNNPPAGHRRCNER